MVKQIEEFHLLLDASYGTRLADTDQQEESCPILQRRRSLFCCWQERKRLGSIFVGGKKETTGWKLYNSGYNVFFSIICCRKFLYLL